MDINGNNRYQLLFTDDESMPITLPSKPSKKKLLENGGKLKNNVMKKIDSNINEKENKSNVINKKVIEAGVVTKEILNANAIRNNVEFKNQRSGFRDVRNKQLGLAENGKERTVRLTKGSVRYRSGDRFAKREFDRQSGSDKTGVKSIDKRDGAGAHNWGSLKQEIDDIDKSTDVVNGIEKEETIEANSELNATEIGEAKEMTLDEWKALTQNRSKPQYNLRKAGEGEDTSQWKKMVVLDKKKNDDSEEEYEFDPSLYPQRVGRLQRITDIKFNFSDSKRGFGRDRGRDRIPRNENRDQETKPARRSNNRQSHKETNPSLLRVDDENQFPTLA